MITSDNDCMRGSMNNQKVAGNARRSPERLFTVSRNGSTFHKLFFLNPRPGAEVNSLAKELLALEEVEEVYVTRGDAGFMAQARFSGNKSAEEAARYVRERYGKSIGSEYGRLVSFLDYKR